jgi:hypothetical protein
MPRDYKREYANYQGRPEQIARRSSRNKARRAAVKSGLISRRAKVDINHKDGNPLNNKVSNLQPLGARRNRSFPRTADGRKVNPRD